MKAALIPPTPELRYFGNGDFHLLLSHLVEASNDYTAHYIRQRQLGAYLVLDNSAHEFSAGQNAEKLATQALALRAQEVVVPDVLEDADATIQGAVSAMEVWIEGGAFRDLSPALMYVPQGKTVEDWSGCLNELVQIHKYMAKRTFVQTTFTVGLSKDYEVWDGGLLFLIKRYLRPMVIRLADEKIRMNVHLLGWGRDLWVLNEIAREYPWLRSTDSAKPFVYALNGTRLNPKRTPTYPRRPEEYFSMKMNARQRSTARHNAGMFRKAAAGVL